MVVPAGTQTKGSGLLGRWGGGKGCAKGCTAPAELPAAVPLYGP